MSTSDRSLSENSKKKSQEYLPFLGSTLIWQESISPKTQLALFLASHIQLFAILLWAQFQYTTNQSSDYLARFLKSATTIVSMTELYEGENAQELVSTIVIIIFAYFLFVLILQVWLLYSYYSRKSYPAIEATFAYVAELHYQFLFWIINIVLMQGLMLESFSYKFFGFEVSSRHTAIIAIFVVVLVINYILGLLSARFRFDPFKTENVFACWNPRYQLFSCLLKGVTSIIIVFGPTGKAQQILFWSVALGICIYQRILLLRDIPFFYYQGMQFSLIANGFTTTCSTFCFFTTLFIDHEDISPVTISYLEVILLPILTKFSFSSLKLCSSGIPPHKHIRKIKEKDKLIKSKIGIFSLHNKLYLNKIKERNVF